ncbi:WD40 repeat domain-containing protein [Adhaeribacter sp. BT258]|uniref:WD40 repeat domain-containing protein n=1 Tax=Adhaeribacter terrigena TaxID=2793070 RepID=A0ABS1BXS0_9BACT|nr:WD40 repeat domain-containing protein [Adhaeribacter terrigena]MBK0401953.1 WD40 repeat domain-containing protein [Adhaeribacter terrigena]
MASPLEVTKTATLTGHRDCVYTLERSGLEHVFFSAAGDGFVVAWNLNDPENGDLIANANSSVYALKYLADKDLLVIGQNFKSLQVVAPGTKKLIQTVAMPPVAIFDLAYSEKHQKLYAGLADGSLVEVETLSFSVKKVLKGNGKSLRCLALNEARNELAAGYSDHTIKIFEADTLKLKQEIDAHANSVFTVAYTPDGKYLLSGSRDAHLRVWNAEKNYEEHASIIAHLFTINHLTFSPDGKYFATCSMDKSIKVWDAASFKLLKVIDKARHAGHGTSVNKLFWSGHENALVSCSDDRTISVWDIKLKRYEDNTVRNSAENV